MPQQEKKVLWKDRKHYLWFPFSFTKYSIEDDRLIVHTGLLNTQVEETLLYRIVDLTCKQSLLGKLFGTGDIVLKTKADTNPEVVLKNIRAPLEVRSQISSAVENSRQQRNVVGKEFYGEDHEHMDRDHDGVCDFEETPPV
ncbi:MAG: PH domain-containing protein [Gemmiger sp.]|nr:PH domain-containing protein [Gemmiger sp.]